MLTVQESCDELSKLHESSKACIYDFLQELNILCNNLKPLVLLLERASTIRYKVLENVRLLPHLEWTV